MVFNAAWAPLILGIVIGAPMGYVARRSHFCTMAALERHYYGGDDRGLRAWALAALVALAATQVLAFGGQVDLALSFYLTEPFSLGGAILGGLMFGIGMALVGTCGFGAVVRLGGGNLRALVVLTGIGLAALAAQRGLTAYARTALLDPFAVNLNPYGGQSLPALLRHVTGLDLTVPITVAILGFGAWWVFKDKAFRADRSRWRAALVIGVCIAAGWLATSAVHRLTTEAIQIEAGSFVMPVGDGILQVITITGVLPDYGVGLVLGVLFGAALGAWRSNDMRWEACDDARELSRHLLGAFLMGTGGVFALGCTIGQGVSAFSVLAISVPIVMASITLGARIGLSILLEGTILGLPMPRFGTDRDDDQASATKR